MGVPHPIRSADLRLQAHEPPVQLLSDRVGRDCLLQRLQRALEIAGGLAKLGQRARASTARRRVSSRGTSTQA